MLNIVGNYSRSSPLYESRAGPGADRAGPARAVDSAEKDTDSGKRP